MSMTRATLDLSEGRTADGKGGGEREGERERERKKEKEGSRQKEL